MLSYPVITDALRCVAKVRQVPRDPITKPVPIWVAFVTEQGTIIPSRIFDGYKYYAYRYMLHIIWHLKDRDDEKLRFTTCTLSEMGSFSGDDDDGYGKFTYIFAQQRFP